ncbi:MAG: hypothetical protein JO249_13545 [Acidobacteria bacterium]|nr:hypothetical protein [Acidobacteriota bacterium]
MANSIPLAEAIADLRAELLDAVSEGQGKDLHFGLKPIELELSLAVTKEGGATGKVKFWVVELGADGKYQNEVMHKLKLVLEPRGIDGREFQVSNVGEKRPT